MKNIKKVVTNVVLLLFVLTIGCSTVPEVRFMTKSDKLELLNYEPAPLSGYETAYDGSMVYNPLSKEAEKTGTINKFDDAAERTAKVINSYFDAEFTLPTEAAPYDLIPIDYKITLKDKSIGFPLTVEANAFEEPGRGQGKMFDLATPGTMDIDIEYLGYVTGTFKEDARNIMEPDLSDTPAAAYPNYTTTDLIKSGEVQSGEIVWLKFKYTNTGDTILDLEGCGTFTIEPRLSVRQGDSYTDIGGLYNEFVRELTYVYPGESREFWINFRVNSEPYSERIGLSAGDYNVSFTVYYRTEYNYAPFVNMWRGRVMQVANFKFKVSDNPEQVAPEPVIKEFTNGGDSQNHASWLHYFEEFMTTYRRYNRPVDKNVIEDRLWLQVAPFTEQIALKLIYNNPKTLSRVEVPFSIDEDGIEIKYNPDNINTVVDEDGYAWPVIYAQTMADMRANIEVSPYPEIGIVNDLLDMKDCGVNVLNTQGAPWLYDIHVDTADKPKGYSNLKGDALRYVLDLARHLNLKMDSIATYSYGRATIGGTAKWLTGKTYPISLSNEWEADYGDDDVAKATAPVYLYQRERWGDIYWHDANGVYNYTVEDTRGYFRYEMDMRFPLGRFARELFQEWLEEKYSTVEAMNAAWGTDYKKFTDVNPERGQKRDNSSVLGTLVVYNNNEYGFGEWGPAIIDLDIFRTELRVKNYNDCIGLIRETQPSATFLMRTEGSNFSVPGLDPKTDNAHYRFLVYEQLRNASVAEVLLKTDAIRGYADYPVLPLTPSEVSDVVSKSVNAGLIPMVMPQFDVMRDFAINDKYGRDAKAQFNLTEDKKFAIVYSLSALFPWWKATYEAGGVPGVLWQDLQCDGIVTETQQKEMKYFKSRLEKELNKPEVLKQRKVKNIYPQEIQEGKYTYDPEFIIDIIETVQNDRLN